MRDDPQPYGWVGATAVTVFTPFAALTGPADGVPQRGWFFDEALVLFEFLSRFTEQQQFPIQVV